MLSLQSIFYFYTTMGQPNTLHEAAIRLSKPQDSNVDDFIDTLLFFYAGIDGDDKSACIYAQRFLQALMPYPYVACFWPMQYMAALVCITPTLTKAQKMILASDLEDLSKQDRQEFTTSIKLCVAILLDKVGIFTKESVRNRAIAAQYVKSILVHINDQSDPFVRLMLVSDLSQHIKESTLTYCQTKEVMRDVLFWLRAEAKISPCQLKRRKVDMRVQKSVFRFMDDYANEIEKKPNHVQTLVGIIAVNITSD